MTTMYEGRHTGEHLLQEANGTRSREVVTVTQTGTAMAAGTVLGKITATSKYVPYSNTATDGSETAAAVLYDTLDAATGDKEAVVHVRDCEVNVNCLTGFDAAAKVELAALGVITR